MGRFGTDGIRGEVGAEISVELALALGPDLLDAGHDLFEQRANDVEPARHLRVLELVAQVHEREQLAGHVAVLAEALDLVVAQLRVGVPERRGVGVLVHLVLPAGGGHGAEGDEHDFKQRSAAFYRERLRALGLRPLGSHCWLSPALVPHATALELPD